MKSINNFCVFFLLFSIWAKAQDNHYNAQQFGARTTLLGGAVVGGLEDNSSMYYNPAALAFAETNNLTVHTNAHSVEYINFKNGLGYDVRSFSLRYIPLPQEVSAIVTSDPQKRLKIGYIILNKTNNSNDFSQRHSYNADLNRDYAGDEYYVGQLDLQNIITERWAGVCASFKFSENLSFGFTPFGSYRSQRYLYNLYSMLSSSPVSTTNALAYQRYYDALRLNVISLFIKAGVHYRNRNWRYGITFTTPSIRIWGDARIDRNISFFGLERPDAVFDDRQWYVPGHYRQPANLAIGAINVTNYYRLCYSASFHLPVRDYRMAEAEFRDVGFPSSTQSTGLIDFLGFRNKARAVLNFAFGFEYKLSDRIKSHCSIRTDFANQRRRNPISVVNLAAPRLANPSSNLYHISGGLSYKRKQSVFTAGLTYSFGRVDKVFQHADFDAPFYPINIWGFPGNTGSLRHHIVTATFGYTYYFDTFSMEEAVPLDRS